MGISVEQNGTLETADEPFWKFDLHSFLYEKPEIAVFFRFTDVAFGQLDGLGVYNWFVDVLKFRLGEKTFEAMERHTPRCLTTTKVSHILCQKGYNGAVVQRIDRVFGEVGGFHESEQCAHWKQGKRPVFIRSIASCIVIKVRQCESEGVC